MLKHEVRKLFRQKRAALTSQQRLKMDDLLLIQFQQLPLPPLASVLSFYPIEGKSEIDSFILTDYLKFTNPGLQVAYPKTDMGSCTMQAIIESEATEFEENAHGIPEPADGEIINPFDLDAVLVPMLAFDAAGHRVGYGKGFYDRFLESCREDCLKIGVCYFEPVPTIEDAGKYDVPLDYCITPQTIYVF